MDQRYGTEVWNGSFKEVWNGGMERGYGTGVWDGCGPGACSGPPILICPHIYIYIVIRSSSMFMFLNFRTIKKINIEPVVHCDTHHFFLWCAHIQVLRTPFSVLDIGLSTGCPWKDCGTIVLFLDCILGISWKLSCNCTMSFCTSCTWAALFPK